MAFFNKRKSCSCCATGVVVDFPESEVNPLYKPKTLGELRAEMVHTGQNPAPASLRPGVVAAPGIDPMDAPAIPVTGDTFEHIRAGKAIAANLSSKEEELKKASQPSPTPPSEDPAPPAPPAD